MSCAEICLTYSDCEASEFNAERMMVARKLHRCCECHQSIEPGNEYERAVGKSDGSFFSLATCAPCAEIRKAFACGAWTYGELWQVVREQLFPAWDQVGPYDCLAQLTTEAARDECRRRYAQWQSDRE